VITRSSTPHHHQAHLKFCDWSPLPLDPPTLAIINDIHKIWDVWNSIPPTEEYMSYSHMNHVDHSSLGPRSETRTRSCSGKQSDWDHDGELSRESRASKHEWHSGGAGGGDMLECGILTDATPSLDLSSSNESCNNLPDFEDSGNVQAWRDTLLCVQTFSPWDFNESNKENAGIGSPKVTEYKSWEPRWDQYYHRRCNLTGKFS